jgi:hypothetical protein
MIVIEIRASEDEFFIMKKFQESVDAWRDTNKWSTNMLNILRKVKEYDFVLDNSILKIN